MLIRRVRLGAPGCHSSGRGLPATHLPATHFSAGSSLAFTTTSCR